MQVSDPAKSAYDAVMAEASRSLAKYAGADEQMAMLRMVEVCAYERAARIINDVGVKAGGDKDAILSALWQWVKDFDGSHTNFAHWNRQLLYSMNFVSDSFRKTRP